MSSLFDVKILDLVSSLHPRDSSGYSENYNRYIEFLGNVFCPGVRGSAPVAGAGSGIRLGRDELLELVAAAGGCSSSRCGWSKESQGAQEGRGADVSIAPGPGVEQSVRLVEKAVEGFEDGRGGVFGADGDADGQRVSDRVDVNVRCGHGLSHPDESVVDVDASNCDGLAGILELGKDVVRGKNYLSNKKKRDQRKRRAKLDRMSGAWRRGDDAGVASQNVPTLQEFVGARADEEILRDKAEALEQRLADESALRSAKRTLAEKWARENELAAEKAKRALDVLRAQDLQVEIKRQATSMRLHTERNMVGMEKAHQFLKKTGNVPGFAQTVLSDEGLTDGSSATPASPGECTISPDSSASMKEFRELMKKCADQQAKLDQFHKMTKIHPDYIELYKKQTWTINSENVRILDEMYPQGHALNPIPDYENYDAPTHGELIVGRDEEYFPY